jgi:hypothetical protein
MNDQDHSLSLSDPDRSLVLSHLLVNFLINLASCQTGFRGRFKPEQDKVTSGSLRRKTSAQSIVSEGKDVYSGGVRK